jgi:hypothetical protein
MKFKDCQTKGSFLIVFLPCFLAFFGLSLLVWDLGIWALAADRAQNIGDVCLLSSLRVRAEGLERIAERWRDLGLFMNEGQPSGWVRVPRSQWNNAREEANQLRRAISGYQGRVTSVIRVVAEAQGANRDNLEFIREDAQRLNVIPQPVTMRDENNQEGLLVGGWYQRLWSPNNLLGEPQERSAMLTRMRIPILGFFQSQDNLQNWFVTKFTWAELRWDVDTSDSLIRNFGNGGFPRNWGENLQENRVNPFRYAKYDAALILPEEDL